METRSVLVVSFIVVLLALLPGPAFAYDDSLGAHSKINSLALSKFQTEVMPADPYLRNTHIDNTPCTGIAWDPADGDRINPPEIAIQRVKTLDMWVIDGGYSADEPEGTMALCHFYDPTQAPGKRYLTDQQSMVKVLSQYNSEYRNPGIDAVQWAFHGEQYGTVFDQQYSWDQGKSSLKKALESPDPNNVNYGKAWRSLGETMHLMADMTVPAHVRNDGHASALNDPDPYESSTTWQLVQSNAGNAFASGINYDQSPEQLMSSVASYTNSHFLSKDTIPLPTNVSSPWHKYAQPSVEGLTPSAQGYLTRDINGESSRMAKTRSLWSYLFNTGKQEYMIDDNVCNDQRKVLIPTAIKADEILVSDFLPRFQVTAQVNSTSGNGKYTMTGGIKGIDKGEWLQISSVKIRNGARIIVTDPKTGKETITPVKLIDPSRDLNSFSYDFVANPGDTVRLEYDLGGYVVTSLENAAPEPAVTPTLTTATTNQKPPEPFRNFPEVPVPPAPQPLKQQKSSNGESFSYYNDKNGYVRKWGPFTTTNSAGMVTAKGTYLDDESAGFTVNNGAFDSYIGYQRYYQQDGKTPREIKYYNAKGVLRFDDTWTTDGAPSDKYDYSEKGIITSHRFYFKNNLQFYDEYDTSGKMTVRKTFDEKGNMIDSRKQ
jgi:hypothetical protein